MLLHAKKMSYYSLEAFIQVNKDITSAWYKKIYGKKFQNSVRVLDMLINSIGSDMNVIQQILHNGTDKQYLTSYNASNENIEVFEIEPTS